ncbi:Hypothetical predicted protein, partial [Mytilus galloprovincialis]
MTYRWNAYSSSKEIMRTGFLHLQYLLVAYVYISVNCERSDKITTATKFLKTFGYLSSLKDNNIPSRGRLKTALRSFQNNYGIMPTGKLNKRTIRMMKKPRCGKPDINKTRRTRSTNESFRLAEKCYYVGSDAVIKSHDKVSAN